MFRFILRCHAICCGNSNFPIFLEIKEFSENSKPCDFWKSLCKCIFIQMTWKHVKHHSKAVIWPLNRFFFFCYFKEISKFPHHMSLFTTKPVFGVCDQVSLKPACSATEASYSLGILNLASIGIILSRQRTTKVLIRLRGCAGWSAYLLFAYGKKKKKQQKKKQVSSWRGSNRMAARY